MHSPQTLSGLLSDRSEGPGRAGPPVQMSVPAVRSTSNIYGKDRALIQYSNGLFTLLKPVMQASTYR